jgi:hypothetical protein
MPLQVLTITAAVTSAMTARITGEIGTLEHNQGGRGLSMPHLGGARFLRHVSGTIP